MPIEIGNLRKQKSSSIFLFFIFGKRTKLRISKEKNIILHHKVLNWQLSWNKPITVQNTCASTTILLHKHMNQNTQPMHTYKIEEIDFTCPNDETTSLFNPLTFIRSIRFVINRQRYSCKKQSNYNPTDEKLRYIVLKLSISHLKNT